MNTDQIKKYLHDLCLISGLSGYEDEVRKYLSSQLDTNKLKNTSDVLGNLICTLPGNDNLPSVMLFAHMDQLGFVIKKIEDNGFIRIERLGGVPEKALTSQEMVIVNNKGQYINAVIGNKSHHATTIDEKYKVSLVKDLFLDAGFSNKKEVLENGINIGSPITYLPSFNDIGSNCVAGIINKSFSYEIILEPWFFNLSSKTWCFFVSIKGNPFGGDTIRINCKISIKS